jgi:hypothetical protein
MPVMHAKFSNKSISIRRVPDICTRMRAYETSECMTYVRLFKQDMYGCVFAN